MKTFDEIRLTEFNFWAGAKDNAKMLTYEEMEMVDDALMDIYPEGISSTTINDLFWFDFDFICECIGLAYDAENDEVIR